MSREGFLCGTVQLEQERWVTKSCLVLECCAERGCLVIVYVLVCALLLYFLHSVARSHLFIKDVHLCLVFVLKCDFCLLGGMAFALIRPPPSLFLPS